LSIYGLLTFRAGFPANGNAEYNKPQPPCNSFFKQNVKSSQILNLGSEIRPASAGFSQGAAHSKLKT
jgi:hypothetical protein